MSALWRRTGAEPEPERDELQELLDEIDSIEALSRRLVKDLLAGGYASAFKGAGVEFDEVREYVPGDEPRSIDWNVTARAGKPFVKRFVDEKEVTIAFLLDVSASMYRAGLGAWSARQMATRFMACMGFAAVANDDKVGFVAATDRVEKHRRPAKGRQHLLTVLRDALGLRPAGTNFSLGAALDHFAATEPRRVGLFVCSDFLGATAEQITSRFAKIAGRHDVTAVRILGPEFLLPIAVSQPGSIRMVRTRDPERPDRTRIVDWSRAEVRAAYAASVDGWRRDSDSAFARAGVEVLDLPIPREPSTDAVVRPIMSYFARHARP